MPIRSPTHEPIVMIRPPSGRCLSAAWVADEHAAQVDVDHAVHLLDRGLLERLGDGGAGIVDEDVEPAKRGDGLLDRGLDRLWGRPHRLGSQVAVPPASSIAFTTSAAASAPCV